MSTEVRQIAQEKIKKLEEKIRGIESEINELHVFIQTYDSLKPSKPSNMSSDGKRADIRILDAMHQKFLEGIDVGQTPTQATLNAIELLLWHENGPMKPREIYRALQAANIEVRGASPENNVSAMLSNAKPRFDNSSGSGWIATNPKPQHANFFGTWMNEDATFQ